jgi:hypothetical protein
MIKLNPEEFTDESAERLTYTEVEELNSLNFLYDIDQKDVINLLLSIVADADNQNELIEYLVNWNTGT